ncbi:MAG: hypothetical protein RAO92_07065 [Candidatus Euphemobacter frigidus]|nr:hypothetical protein [Candidatus Euphemobacter frigidus]MDP8276147.1 hypothetical protein [Candidatus Euphemobacter frigidus]
MNRLPVNIFFPKRSKEAGIHSLARDSRLKLVGNIIFLSLLLPMFLVSAPAEARTKPPLSELLAASEYLAEGEIPEDRSSAAGMTPVYVATDGDDSNSGLSPSTPKKHLGAAIEYANANPAVPFVIYLRGGTYYRPALYEYLMIERGDLMITAYPGEEVTIRPDIWPANPTSWGEEVLFHSYYPGHNITICNLTLEGWSTPFVFGTQFDQPPLENLVIKNIRAREFRKRGPTFISELFSANYVTEGYFSGREFDPLDPGIKYQIEGLIFSDISIEGVDMPTNIGDEDDANVKGLRITGVEVYNDPQPTGSTAVNGFAVVNCHNVLIDNCRVENIEGDGIDAKSFRVCVINTLLSGIGRNGVKFWHGGEVINSVIYDADAGAAFVIEEGPCRMINSILMKKGDGYAGTYAWGEPTAEKFEVANSIFIDLDHTFYVGTPDLRSRNSLYFNMPGGLYSGLVSAVNVAALNEFPACSDNISGGPLLVNPEGGDFRASYASPCRDNGGNTGILLPSFDFYGNPRKRGRRPDIGPVEAADPVFISRADYDGDGDSDIAVYRDSTGLWAARGITRLYFGKTADIPIPADYDGDGTSEVGIYRRITGLWAIRGISRFYFGTVNDLPIPADYDGDGRLEHALFRESNGLWIIRGISRFYYGRRGDYPVPGDYDNDGSTEPGIFRPAEAGGLWAIKGISRFYFGGNDDIPVPGKFAGGRSQAGIFRPSTGLWALRGGARCYLGTVTDIPIRGDGDGDGSDEMGIFRPDRGLWVLRGITRVYFGKTGDIPIIR